MRAVLTWPRLISFWSAMTGLAIAVFPAEEIVHHGSFRQPYPERLAAFLVFAAIIGFIFLSVFLYLGRLWARRALIGALICFIGAILSFIVSKDWRLVSHDLTRIAIYIIVLVPPASVLAVLFHPDVARAFPPKGRSSE